MPFSPKFSITIPTTSALNRIERTRGFLDAAKLSEEWIKKMQNRALVHEAHYTTHIEGTHLTLEQSEQLLAGEQLNNVNPNEVRELLNYKNAFDFGTSYITAGGHITEGLVLEIHRRLVDDVR